MSIFLSSFINTYRGFNEKQRRNVFVTIKRKYVLFGLIIYSAKVFCRISIIPSQHYSTTMFQWGQVTKTEIILKRNIYATFDICLL